MLVCVCVCVYVRNDICYIKAFKTTVENNGETKAKAMTSETSELELKRIK